MHGVELDEVDADMCHDEYDIDLCQDDLEEASCCSNGCMDCLGLSNRDFMQLRRRRGKTPRHYEKTLGLL